MKFRENCKYAIVVPTSMGVRICPMNGQPVQASDTFFMHATSAESNVVSVAAFLGMKTKVLTTFVKDSPIADFIKRNLRSRGIDYEGAEVELSIYLNDIPNYNKGIYTIEAYTTKTRLGKTELLLR